MSDEEDNTPPESLFFMRRAEFVPKFSAAEFKSVSASLNENDGSNNKLVGKAVQPSPAPVKRSRRKRAAKKVPVEPEENLEEIKDSLNNHRVVLSASAKRRLKKQQEERASELRLIKAANKQVLAAAESASLDEVEEIFVDKTEKNTITILTISYLSETARLRCYENEKFAVIFPRIADLFKLKASELLLCLREQNIKVDDTPKSLNITLTDTIECIPYKADENAEVDSDDKVKIFFQSSDSKEKIDLLAHKLQKLEEIMEKYSKLRDIPLEQLIFEFDGERIQGTETPEDLDMESGNCIDVKIKPPDTKANKTRQRLPKPKEAVIEIVDDSNDSDVLICD